MEIKLSVIIPCYNHGKYLPEALASIDNSVYRNQVEVIIVNDGSTDPLTNEVIDNLDPNKYVVIKQENQGLARSRNNGIRTAKADYVLMLDADNYIEPVFITDFFEFINKGNDFDALYGNAQCFGLHDGFLKPGKVDLFRLIHRNYIDACAIFRRRTILDAGLYDSDMPHMGLEDWDLWIRLAFSNRKLKYVNKIYFNYRVLGNSMIRRETESNLNKTNEYIYRKNNIDTNKIDQLIENYISESIDFKTIIKIFLKKIKLHPSFRYKISKLKMIH
jgi:glycosyltransferase involved in cell wall biosynthesis